MSVVLYYCDDFIVKTTSHWSRCIVLILSWWLPRVGLQCYSHYVKYIYTRNCIIYTGSVFFKVMNKYPTCSLCFLSGDTEMRREQESACICVCVVMWVLEKSEFNGHLFYTWQSQYYIIQYSQWHSEDYAQMWIETDLCKINIIYRQTISQVYFCAKLTCPQTTIQTHRVHFALWFKRV